MASYTIKDIRNIALISHAGAGKTTLGEAILHNAGVSSRFGKVEDGTTVSDYSEDERERKVSINASVLSFDYSGKHINIIDTPGYADFTGEVLSCLIAVDNAIVLVDAMEGVEVGTEKVWAMADKYNLSRLIFINKMNKENINFNKTVEDVKARLGKGCVPVTMPIGSGSNFKGVVNLMDKSGIDSLSGAEKDNASKMRDALIEVIAEKNDELLEKYLEGTELTAEEIVKGFKKGVASGEIFPVFCGASVMDIGVKELLAEAIKILPSPDERSARMAKDEKTNEDIALKPDVDAPFAAYVFKSISDPYVGQLTIFRIFSGSLKSDTGFYNVTKQAKERIGSLLSLFGKDQKTVPEAIAGDIVAVAKLKNTSTGDSLCDDKNKVIFPTVSFPEPAMSFSVKPKSRHDEDKISTALHKLMAEDQTFITSRDEQTKELIVSGMGDLHLDIMINRLKKRFNVEVDIGTPKVAYKETIKKSAKVQNKYKRQTGGHGQYGDVWIEIEPLERGKGFEFVDKIVGGAIPKNYIPAVEKGVLEAMSRGVISGNPLVDIRVTLYDGSYHDVDSSDMAFKIAGSGALKKAVQDANVVLLEPIMDVDIIVPDEFMGDITGNLSSRRGKIAGMDVQGKNQVIKAKVPLAEMFKYASELKSMTGGRGSYTMRFSHYEEVPAKIVQTIIAKYEEQRKEEQEK
ncbi:MAG: elongation factor G [Candidatus Omnitrophica bacterium]|nr:elongation factor G [Candidatus Omnitrophota bacterium]MBU1932856.1 elongation factor G [Candidatus Omnitrophota bacterium]